MKKNELISAAKELNEVLGLEPPIDFNASPGILIESLQKASELIEPEDDFTEKTLKVLQEISEKKKASHIAEASKASSDVKKSKTRKTIMAEIVKNTIKKPLSKKEMVEEMKKKYGGSEAEAKLQVSRYIQFLLELDLINVNDGKYTYRG